MKKLLIASISFALFLGLIWLGINALAKHMYSRTDCARFNIDNIELRAHIDIPNVIDGQTKCESDGKIKTSSFILDLNPQELESYILKNEFINIDSLYINQGENEDTRWKAILNPETFELNVKIEYLE